MRRKGVKVLIVVVLLAVLGIAGFLQDRENARETGRAHGYATGYSIGYSDYLSGRKQNAQKLATEIVPYEAGTGEWKYFIMSFSDGYDDAQTGENLWYTDES